MDDNSESGVEGADLGPLVRVVYASPDDQLHAHTHYSSTSIVVWCLICVHPIGGGGGLGKPPKFGVMDPVK